MGGLSQALRLSMLAALLLAGMACVSDTSLSAGDDDGAGDDDDNADDDDNSNDDDDNSNDDDDDDNADDDDDDDDDDAAPDDDDVVSEDLDGDGYPFPEDCDDLDPAVHPGADDDQCDGIDQDCDGAIDDDVDLPPDPSSLGNLTEDYETFVAAYLFPDGDEDSFVFTLDDPLLGYFDLEVWLYGVPEGGDYVLELHLIDAPDPDDEGLIAFSDQYGPGGLENIDFGGSAGHDDSGLYEVIVRSVGGASCSAPYLLQLISGSW